MGDERLGSALKLLSENLVRPDLIICNFLESLLPVSFIYENNDRLYLSFQLLLSYVLDFLCIDFEYSNTFTLIEMRLIQAHALRAFLGRGGTKRCR